MKFYKSQAPEKYSNFTEGFNFESLRTCYDEESIEVMKRITQYDTYNKIMSYLWPDINKETSIKKALNIKSLYEFQTFYMRDAIWKIVNSTSSGLTWSGLEHLDKNQAYLYIANHRDILLDSAILQIILDREEFETSEIAFGSNLIDKGFIRDLCKMNRMFSIKREGNIKELYNISKNLSAYIRHVIIDKNTSVWISQRNGRTKDGNDITQTGLLKMINLSGNSDFKKSFSELQIVPLTISFEYEPCDDLKIQELYSSTTQSKYTKAPGEDINTILTGVSQFKGNIHISFGSPIKEELSIIDKAGNENEKIKLLGQSIDKQIYQNYKLNKTNYIAYDLLNQKNTFMSYYETEEKANFIEYVYKKINGLTGDKDILKNLFITLYANPVLNMLKTINL